MIRLWFTRGTSVSVREQLTAQLLLGILSRRLAPGERLPSVRDLARRLRLHSNTISAVYSELAERGWLEARHGSGVFVRSVPNPAPEVSLDVYARSCLEEGVRRGFTLGDLQEAFQRVSVVMETTRDLVVVDQDPELAAILAVEIQEAVDASVRAATIEQAPALLKQMRESDTFVLATHRSIRRVRHALPACPINPIEVKSLEELLTGVPPLPSNGLLAVVSRSQMVLHWAETLLPSLGVTAAAFILRDPNRAGWAAGLNACSVIAVDVKSAGDLSSRIEPLVFRLISRKSLDELRTLASALC